jgi:uncharacterized protein YjbJ (UPF0337 family)
MSKDSTSRIGAEGVVEGVKGKTKEVAGALIDDEELREEGRAQQHKADEQRSAAKSEADAKASRSKAEAHEATQRSHQR